MSEIQKFNQINLGVGPALVGDFFQPGIRKDQEGLVSQIVSTTCEERYDALGILEVANFAFLFSESNAHDDKQRVRYERKRDAILTGIDQYFVKNQVTFKHLVPGIARTTEYNELTRYLNHLSNPVLESTIAQHKGFNAFLEEVFVTVMSYKKSVAKVSIKDISNLGIEVIVDRSTYDNHENRFIRNQKTQEILGETMQAEATSIQGALVPEKTIAWLSDVHALQIDGLPDYLTDKHGKYALADILSESNTASALEKLLQFIPRIPKGDIIWQILLKNIFFSPPFTGNPSEIAGLFENPELMEKLYAMQLHMAEGVFKPLFFDVPTEKNFDKSFEKMLMNLDDESISDLACCVFGGGLMNAEAMRATLHPERVLQSYRDTYPVVDFMAKQIDEYPPSYRKHVMSIITSSYFKDNLNQIVSNLHARLGNSKQVVKFIEQMKQYALVDLKKIEAEVLNSEYYQDGGLTGEASQQFIEKVKQNESKYGTILGDSRFVENHMHWDILEKNEEDVKHAVCIFPEESIPYEGGFSSIVLTSFVPTKEKTFFMLETKHSFGVIIGTITQDTSDGSFHIHLPTATFTQKEAFVELLTGVVASAMYMNLLEAAGVDNPSSETTIHALTDKIRQRSSFDSPEAVEHAAYAFFRQHGGISDRLLERSGEKGLRDAIHERFDMRILKERLQERSESGQTPEEVNQMVTSLLKKLE